MKRNNLKPAALTAPVTLLLAATTTMAQTQTDSGTAALEEVIVTAQKRSENLMTVPISITAVSAETLADVGADSLSEFNAVVPGINFTGNGTNGISQVSLRGVSGAGAYLLEDPVAIYVDGGYQFNQTFGVSALSDIASIEIVRGPQGTLQGRNATAGAILIRTADPEPQFGGYLTASAATEDEYRIRGAITGPLTPTLSARLALDYIDERGWGENAFDGSRLGETESLSARTVFLWTPSDLLRARLALNFQSNKTSPLLARWSAVTINPDPAAAAVVAAASPPTAPLPQAQRDAILEDDLFALNYRTLTELDTASASLELSYDLGTMSLVSITSGSDLDIDSTQDSDGVAMQGREGYSDVSSSGTLVSQELRLQSDGDAELTWILGAYFSRIEQDVLFDVHNHQYTLPANIHTVFTADQRYLSYAAFADATYEVTSALSLTGGVRYTREEKEFASTRRALSYPQNAPLAPLFSYTPPEASWDDISYRAVASYTMREGLLAYLSYSKGFKSGGFNAFAPDAAFDPEKLYTLELGLKAELLDGRTRASFAVYDSDYENLQVSSGVASGGFVISNAAEAKIQGFEVELEAMLSEQLRIAANAAYIDARYDSFPNAPNAFNQPVDASDNRLLRTPEWQYFAQIVYTAAIRAGWEIESQLSWRWRDTIYFTATDQNASNLRSEPSGELDARISLNSDDDRGLSVALFGRNLTDERVVSNLALTFARPLANFSKPRSYGIELTKRF